MNENEIDRMAEDLFEVIDNALYPLTLDDALALAEALEIRCSNYADAIRDDLRRGRR